MPLTPEQMDRKVEEHFRFEARDDVEGVLGTLAEHVEHDVVGWPRGATRGRAAARAFYEQTFADLADGRVETIRRLHGAGFVVDESMWRGRAVGRPFGLEGRGRPLAFRILHVIQFTDAGEIARENVWLDFAAIRAQLPQDART
ncbi:MAG: ester cyclase [Alphaproteobacteria bacterium]|nr:ester cyclase [Alphaproteobacteria bacterium]